MQVTLALCVTGVVPVLRSGFIFVAQIAGGIAASAVVRGIIPGNEVLFNVKLQTGTSITQGLFLEMFLTAELVFTILMLAAEVRFLVSMKEQILMTSRKQKRLSSHLLVLALLFL
jgi:glycerol uptake facilitator-like aquaporin